MAFIEFPCTPFISGVNPSLSPWFISLGSRFAIFLTWLLNIDFKNVQDKYVTREFNIFNIIG